MSNSMWVVSWRYNDKDYSESFEFRTLAECRMIQLEAFGMRPTLHLK